MKLNKYLAVLAALLIVCGILLISTSKSHAAPNQVTRSFTGFAFEKSILTPSMKTEIGNWVKANPGYGLVSCTGYTGFNVKKRDQVFLQKLAVARATTICNFIHGGNGGIAIHSTRGIPGDGKTASARKVTVTLTKVPDDGNGGGTGTVTIGVCDSSLTAVMRSRLSGGNFYFSMITIRNISTTCSGNVLDIYLLDKDGNQLASSLDNEISKTWLRASYSLFDPTNIRSDEIKQVAFEIRKN
jgi:hypothetical protein